MHDENPYVPSQIEAPSAWNRCDSLTRKQFIAMIVVLAMHIPSFFSPIIEYREPSLPIGEDRYSQNDHAAYHLKMNLRICLKYIPLAIVGLLSIRNQALYSILTLVCCTIMAIVIAIGIAAGNRLGFFAGVVKIPYYFELASVALLTFVTAYSRSWIIQRYPHGRKYTALKATEDASLE